MKFKSLSALMLSAAIVIFAAPASTSATAPATAELYSALTRNLTIGAVGEDVRVLQRFLNANGFIVASSGPGSSGNESTYFGAATTAALSRYQSSVGISPAAGYFGPTTRSRVTSSTGSGGVTPSTVSTTNTIVIIPPGETTPASDTSLTIETASNEGQITWNTVSKTFSPHAPNFIIKNNGSTNVNISRFDLIMSGSLLSDTTTVSFKLSLIDSNNVSLTLPETYTLTNWSPSRINFMTITIPAGQSVLFSLRDISTTALYSGSLNIKILSASIASYTGTVLGPLSTTPLTRLPIQVITPTSDPASDTILYISTAPPNFLTNITAGAENQYLDQILLSTIREDVIINQITLNINTDHLASIQKLKLYQINNRFGSPINLLLGETSLINQQATITISNLLVNPISSGHPTILVVKADIAPVGPGMPGRLGTTISLSLPAGAVTGTTSSSNRFSAPPAPLYLNQLVTVVAPAGGGTTTPTPSNTISGRVINENDVGVSNVSVSLSGQRTATTDENGVFSFTPSFLGYRAGTIYTLSATVPSDYATVIATNSRVISRTFTYQVFDVDCGTGLDACSNTIAPLRSYASNAYANDLSTDTGFIFRLIRPSQLPVHVSVVDNSGNPMSNVKVSVSRNEVGRTDRNGELTFNAGAAPLSFHRGALYLISVEAPSGYYVTASNARVRAQSYNWQALGVDCRTRSSDCLSALSSLRLESNIDNAAAYDLAEDNFVFTIAPVASSTRTPTGNVVGGANNTGNGTQIPTDSVESDPNPTTPTVIFPNITGRVTDDSGAGVSGATIAINNVTRATTGADGSFTILGSNLRFRKGALFQISVGSVPFSFDSIRATRSRTRGASIYNYQALDVNCADLVSGECRDTLAALDLYRYLNNTYPVDLADDNFTFMVVRPASSPNYSNPLTGPADETTISPLSVPSGPFSSASPSYFDIYGTVTDYRGNGIVNASVSLNNGIRTTNTQADGSFLFNGADIRFRLGASYSLTVTAPPGTNYSGSQALSGSTVVGASYQWQILGFDCRGSSDAICVGDSPTKDFPSDTQFHFILKDRASSSANSSLNTASALTQLGRILFFWR